MVVGRSLGRNLTFSRSVEASTAAPSMLFILVDIPTKTKAVGGRSGQRPALGLCLCPDRRSGGDGPHNRCEEECVAVRMAALIQTILEGPQANDQQHSFSLLSNPEFLAEGTAIGDLEAPDRVLIVGHDPGAIEALAGIYGHWVDDGKILRNYLLSS